MGSWVLVGVIAVLVGASCMAVEVQPALILPHYYLGQCVVQYYIYPPGEGSLLVFFKDMCNYFHKNLRARFCILIGAIVLLFGGKLYAS